MVSSVETPQVTSNPLEDAVILKIALFVADTPSPTVVEKFGDYTDIFPDMFHRAISQSGRKVRIEVDNFDVTKMQYPTEVTAFQAVIITGAACSAAGDDPWILRLNEYLQQLVKEAPECKIVGICFGHQIVARALGGIIGENPMGWELGYTEVKLTKAGKKLLNTTRHTLGLQQMHQDIITQKPPGLEVLCYSDQCKVQALMKPNHILTVQAHPEFPPNIIKEIIRFFEIEGKFSKQTVNQVLEKLDVPDDGTWFAIKIIEFLMGNFIHVD